MIFEKDKYYQSKDGEIVVQALEDSKGTSSSDCITVKVKRGYGHKYKVGEVESGWFMELFEEIDFQAKQPKITNNEFFPLY